MENYYEILGCDVNASFQEIKKAYQDLIRKIHPDKLDHGKERSASSSYDFAAIDRAWKTLRDPEERSKYDELLRQETLNQQNLLFGTFNINELDYDPVKVLYSYKCRCGGTFSFSREGCEAFNSFLVACEQCSLVISVDT